MSPRSTITNRRGNIFDRALQLYDPTAPAIAVTTSGTPIPLASTRELEFHAVVNVQPYTGFVAGTAYWAITIEIADTLSGPYKPVGTVQTTGEQHQYRLPLSGPWIEDIDGAGYNAAYIRVTATLTGAAGPLQFGCFLAPEY